MLLGNYTIKVGHVFLSLFLFLIIGCGSDLAGGDDPGIKITSPENEIETIEQIITVKGSALEFTEISLNIKIAGIAEAKPIEVAVADDGLWETKITIGSPVITKEIEIAISATNGETKSNDVTFKRIPGTISINSPADLATVSEQNVQVKGNAVGGFTSVILRITVDLVSVPDQTVVVGDDGTWATSISVGDTAITKNIAVTILATDVSGAIASKLITFTRIAP